MAFLIKSGDELPSLRGTITDDTGAPFNLTGATVSMVLTKLVTDATTGEKTPGQVPLFSKPATVVNAAAGIVQYDWASGDTNDYGDYAAEFEATISGKRLTVPTSGYIAVTILDSLQT